jgi:chromosome segregation ATPase
MQLSEAELHDLRRAREDLTAEITALKRQLESGDERTKDFERQQQLVSAQLEEARTRESALQSELAATRESFAERERQLADSNGSNDIAEELKTELDSARSQLDSAKTEVDGAKHEAAELRTSLDRAQTELADLRDAREGLAAELAELQRRIESEKTEAEERTGQHEAMATELEEVRAREAELRAEFNARSRDIAGQQETTHALNDAVTKAEQKAEEALNQVAELQAELNEEKEYSENLSEQANSRLDQVNKLQDSVEEAEERLNDALWRLEKASHFKRLVNRRKGLIASLIDALRTKNKAMVALKAGLDSLRTHKALVEETQQKLLVRMEALKSELSAAKEKIKGLEADASTVQQQELSDNQGELNTLQERLGTQTELIQSLEDELKTAKAFRRDASEKDIEVTQLQEELETKNAIVARLQSDLDEQQRKLAKLRGSDGETMRLKAVTEQDKSKIDVLERENAELRAMIESAEQSGSGSGEMTDEREIELQAKIAELTESVAKWKKKYEFVSTEAPAAYQTQSAAEQ